VITSHHCCAIQCSGFDNHAIDQFWFVLWPETDHAPRPSLKIRLFPLALGWDNLATAQSLLIPRTGKGLRIRAVLGDYPAWKRLTFDLSYGNITRFMNIKVAGGCLPGTGQLRSEERVWHFSCRLRLPNEIFECLSVMVQF